MKQLSPLALVFIAGVVHAAGEVSERECRERITAQSSAWRFYPVAKQVFDAAKRGGSNPTIAKGDFDDDREGDVAFLVQFRSAEPAIAVCLSSTQGVYVIDEPYCSDGIARMRKGRAYYDYELEKEGRYARDGIQAYCFEKAGATYLFEDGKFVRIVDSD